MTAIAGIDWAKAEALKRAEEERYVARTPRSATLAERARRSMPSSVPMQWMAGLYRAPVVFAAEGQGSSFTDVDGNRYIDFNQSDLAGTLGFAHPAITRALSDQASHGAAFLLPTEDAFAVSETLARRTGVPFWQFSGTASSANAEIIRIARLATGRERVLMFEGKYHGHGDDVLVTSRNGTEHADLLGLPSDVTRRARTVPFNDLEALKTALGKGDVACLVAEPMMTNCNIVFPDEGFWEEAARLVRAAGSLFVIDEAHTHSFAYGGLTRAWGLKPDALVLGKGLGTGVPFALYGMNAALAELCERHLDCFVVEPGLALGGTTYGSALAVAVALAALEDCLTQEDYARVETLGMKLADGLEALFARHGLDWRAPRIGGRSGWVLFPELPRDAHEAYRSLDLRFVDLKRLFFANRGVWEAVWSAGPSASFQHAASDIDAYLGAADELIQAIKP
ncbi:MAG: aminotransferase class III-fold pyridoxal phosphate-dependent enzyme [Parvibaculaceae bacterium]